MTYWDHLWKALTDKSFLFFVGFALVVYALIFKQEGQRKGIMETVMDDNLVTAIRFTPICAILIMIMAGINRLDKANPGVSKKIIAGEYGEATAVVVSAMMPGGAGGGQLKTAWESGDRGNVLVCLTAMMALSLNAFMFRSVYLGWKLSLIWAFMAILGLVQVYCITRLLKPWL